MGKKKNQIGEEHAKAKILNDKKRIQKLEEVKREKVAKKKVGVGGFQIESNNKKRITRSQSFSQRPQQEKML